jgi:hypothetical protein
MKHLKTFEGFLNEVKLNESDVWAKIRNYFPNPANPEDYINTKITSFGKKTAFTVVIADMISDLSVKDSDAKVFTSTIKNYLKNFDPTGKLKALVSMNESFLNEASTALGPKTKRFDNIIDEWDWFTDANGGEENLPKEWGSAIKSLNIDAKEAIVCFFDAVGSAEDVRDAANKAGLKFTEVDSDNGSSGIVFSAKQ